LSLQQKYNNIKYFEEIKTYSGGKSMYLDELGEWAMKRYGDVFKRPPNKASLNHVLNNKTDILL